MRWRFMPTGERGDQEPDFAQRTHEGYILCTDPRTRCCSPNPPNLYRTIIIVHICIYEKACAVFTVLICFACKCVFTCVMIFEPDPKFGQRRADDLA